HIGYDGLQRRRDQRIAAGLGTGQGAREAPEIRQMRRDPGGQGHDMASPSMTKTGARPACNARQTARRKKSSTSPEQNCGDHVEGGSGFHAGSGRKERAYTD